MRDIRSSSARSLSFLTRNHANEHGARARAIEFAEIDRLPRAEHQLAVLDEGHRRAADQARQDVRRRIALGVEIFAGGRNHPLERRQHVATDVRIGVFVDADARGRMGHEEMTDAAHHTDLAERPADGSRDVDDLAGTGGVDLDLVHAESRGALKTLFGYHMGYRPSRRSP